MCFEVIKTIPNIEQIPVQQLGNGLHFLHIDAPNKQPITLKFVIQKL
jgi:hypothetical protein